jgi:hypothetical protein
MTSGELLVLAIVATRREDRTPVFWARVRDQLTTDDVHALRALRTTLVGDIDGLAARGLNDALGVVGTVALTGRVDLADPA